MKSMLIRILASVCSRTGAILLMNCLANYFCIQKGRWSPVSIRRRHSDCFQILTYHHVSPNYGAYGIDSVPPTLFKRQMAYLARNFNVRAIEEILECIRGGKALPNNCVAITFDDGYADHYVYAYQILKAYGLKATFFLPTGHIGTGKMLWFDQVLYAFERTDKTVLNLPNLHDKVSLATEHSRFLAAMQTLHFFRALELDELGPSLNDLFDRLAVRPPDRDFGGMLTWAQVSEMSENGYYFGSHTVSHPILSRTSVDRAERELFESKKTIEQKIGEKVRTFAYPSGRAQDYSFETISAVKRAGYEAAVTNGSYQVNSVGDDLYRLNRLRPADAHLPTFFLKLCFYKVSEAR